MTDGPVVVTGAASGIGRATTLRAATDGARVIALDLDAAGLATLGREATDTLAEGRLETITVDVADAPTVAAAIEALVARAGPVAALVNAALRNNVGFVFGKTDFAFRLFAIQIDDTLDRADAIQGRINRLLRHAFARGLAFKIAQPVGKTPLLRQRAAREHAGQ